MANSYTTATLLFNIDTATDADGLATLKLAAPDIDDDLYIANGATLTLSATTTLKAIYDGISSGGATSTADIVLLTGADLLLAEGTSGGIFIHNNGQLTLAGGAVRPGAGQTEVPIQLMDGIISATNSELDTLEFLCAVAGSIDLTRSSMTVLMSATNELIISGTMVLASSEISSGNRWACLNYDTVSMDVFSTLRNAYFAITYSGGSLIFLDDPDGYTIDWGNIINRASPLGGSKGRGKRLGRRGRTMQITGTFDTENTGTNHITTWQMLQYYLTLNETFKLTWSEGSINKFLFSRGDINLNGEDVDERPYRIEVSEIA